MKKSNNKKSSDLEKELSEKIVFRIMFEKMISEEKSDFGKLLLQENLIFDEIIILLSRIDLHNKYILKNEFNNVKENIKSFRKYTLGHLINVLRLFLPKKSRLLQNLKKYNNLRNKLTHKIFAGKYKKASDLYVEATVAVIIGNGILHDIKKLQDKITEDILST